MILGCWLRTSLISADLAVSDASAVLGFAVFLGEIGQDGAHCRWEVSLKILPPNSPPQHTKRHAAAMWPASTPASPLGPGEQVHTPHISEWIDLKLKGWQDRQASCLITWHYQARLLRGPLQICNSSLISISFSQDAARTIKQTKNRTCSKHYCSVPFRQFGKS